MTKAGVVCRCLKRKRVGILDMRQWEPYAIIWFDVISDDFGTVIPFGNGSLHPHIECPRALWLPRMEENGPS
jgi:hypothetical protein